MELRIYFLSKPHLTVLLFIHLFHQQISSNYHVLSKHLTYKNLNKTEKNISAFSELTVWWAKQIINIMRKLNST